MQIYDCFQKSLLRQAEGNPCLYRFFYFIFFFLSSLDVSLCVLLELMPQVKIKWEFNLQNEYLVRPGAIIGDGDRKSWDTRGPMIRDNFSIFRTNCAILTSYIRANSRTCRGFSRGCCRVAGSKMVRVASFHSDGGE